MIIYDSIISNLQKVGGISIAFNEIISRLQRHSIKNIVLSFNDDHGSCMASRPRFLERYRDCVISNSADLGNFVFHSTYYRLCNIKSAKTVTTAHDFTYENYVGGLRRLVHSAQKNRAIRHSDKVICISENTKRDLLTYLPDVSEDRIKVVYHGVSERFFPLSAQPAGESVIFVGQRTRYKNFKPVVEAISMVPGIQLECVGGGPFSRDELIDLNRLIPNRYRHLGYISEVELNMAYNKAVCLVYPSLYEGFGMPIVEAMRAGCPVIATNCSSIPEVAGDAALLLDRPTADGIKHAIDWLLVADNRRSLVEKGLLRSQKFNWDKTFEGTVGVYEELLGKKLYSRLAA